MTKETEAAAKPFAKAPLAYNRDFLTPEELRLCIFLANALVDYTFRVLASEKEQAQFINKAA